MSLDTIHDSEAGEVAQSDSGPRFPSSLSIDLEVARLEQATEQASEHSIVDLAEHGLLLRRDATGLVHLTFDEALESVRRGQESPYFERVGQSLSGHILDSGGPVMTRNFLYEMKAYYQGRHVGSEGLQIISRLSRHFDIDDPNNFRRQLVSPPADAKRALGAYGIVRAEVRERYIEQEFGAMFREEKAAMMEWLPHELEVFGLDRVDIERARQQLRHTRLAPQDYLLGSVFNDRGDYRLLGDYMPGSLQTQVYLEGSIDAPGRRDERGVRATMRHELVHAGSFQPMLVEAGTREPDIGALRVGLMGGERQLLDANEGVTEILNRLSSGTAILRNVPGSYDVQVAALYHMATTKVELFADVVVSAFQPGLQPKFGLGLKEFYRVLAAIS